MKKTNKKINEIINWINIVLMLFALKSDERYQKINDDINLIKKKLNIPIEKEAETETD